MAVTQATDSTFKSEVIEHSGLTLVDFWAPWCGPCQMIGPILEELDAERSSELKIVKVNIDEEPETPTELGVRSIPTLMLFKDGKMVDTKVGVLPKTTLSDWVDQHK